MKTFKVIVISKRGNYIHSNQSVSQVNEIILFRKDEGYEWPEFNGKQQVVSDDFSIKIQEQ